MRISFNDMQQIHTAMGSHNPYLAVEGNVLKLQWWDSSHKVDLIVDDFSGHRDYYFNFIKKILLMTRDFEGVCTFKLEPTKQYLLLCNAYLGEKHEI